MSEESINKAFVLTPAGTGAIAVVRLVGPGVREFLERHFSTKPRSGRPVHGRLSDEDRIIDDPVVVLTESGAADLNLHGGVWVVREVLELARREGFEIHERTALPLPAETVDAESVLEQETLAYLPMARTELAVRILLNQPNVWEHFLEQQVKEPSMQQVLDDWSLYWLLHLPRVAIVGPPNVGKSTLANQLFAQERSITADLPGTTRDWVGEVANIDGLAVMLLDTPGQRQAIDPIERLAIERSGGEIRTADLVVLVLDVSRDLEPEQQTLLEQYSDAIIVGNKSDRRARWDYQAAGALPTVATTGQGVDELRRAIRGRFGCDRIDPHRPRWWTPRQRQVISAALHDPARASQMLR